MMKKMMRYVAAALLGALVAVGCSPSGTSENFDKTLLSSGTGEWVYTHDYGSGPEEIHLTFRPNGTGFQTTSTQPEPQDFTWSLTGSRLTFIHNIVMGGDAPIDCTVSTLTATTLVYTENGKRLTLTKQ